MYAVMNVGNSFTQFAWAEAGMLIDEIRRIPTDELLQRDVAICFPGAQDAPLLAASVVPSVGEALLERGLQTDRRLLDVDMIEEVDFSSVDVSTLGADRMANAVAAASSHAGAVIVLDCGTCITTEIVDADARFLGGAILPGRTLLRRALHDHTAQLPSIPLSDSCPRAQGRTTEEAILAGVDLGVLGSVERVLAESRAELQGSACTVVVAGGDAGYFCRHLPSVIPGGPAFTLSGLAVIGGRLFS